jgi:hypothetical protein
MNRRFEGALELMLVVVLRDGGSPKLPGDKKERNGTDIAHPGKYDRPSITSVGQSVLQDFRGNPVDGSQLGIQAGIPIDLHDRISDGPVGLVVNESRRADCIC